LTLTVVLTTLSVHYYVNVWSWSVNALVGSDFSREVEIWRFCEVKLISDIIPHSSMVQCISCHSAWVTKSSKLRILLSCLCCVGFVHVAWFVGYDSPAVLPAMRQITDHIDFLIYDDVVNMSPLSTCWVIVVLLYVDTTGGAFMYEWGAAREYIGGVAAENSSLLSLPSPSILF